MRFNKLKLTALAMTAVMTVGSMSSSAWAFDELTAGAGYEESSPDGLLIVDDNLAAILDSEPAVDIASELEIAPAEEELAVVEAAGEESAAYDVDEASIVFHYDGYRVTYDMVALDGSGLSYEAETTATELKKIEPTCTEPGYLWLQATLPENGKRYQSGNLDDVTTAFTYTNALGHNYVEKDRFVDEFPNCTEEGSGHITQICSRCGDEQAPDIEWKLEAEGHKFGAVQSRYENLNNVKIVNGVPVLEDKTKSGSYDLVTFHVCERYDRKNDQVCGFEEELDRETITMDSEKVTTAIITDEENVAENSSLIGLQPNQVPADEEIELKNCLKDAKYEVTYYDGEGTPKSSKWFPIKAHHMETEISIEFDTIDEANQCSYDPETGKVTNKSCYKTITYYEVIHCTAAGCPNKACKTDKNGEHYTCENQDLKEVSRVEKTAAPEGDHIINTEVYNAIDAGDYNLEEPDDEYIDYDELVKLANDKGSYITITKNTATCTEDGEVTIKFLCKVCKAEVEELVVSTKALGHTWGKPFGEDTVKPTCQTEGSYNIVHECTRCHEKETLQENIASPRLPHTNELREQVVYGEPTYEDDVDNTLGSEVLLAATEGVVVDPVEKGGESIQVGDEFLNEIGYDLENLKVLFCAYTQCETCNDHEVILNGDVKLTVTALEKQKARCLPGTITVTATYPADAADEEDIVASEEMTFAYYGSIEDYRGRTNHHEADPVIENEVEATETEEGSYDEVVYCDICGTELSRTPHTVPVIGHEHNLTKVEAVEATCEEDGNIEYYTCDGCELLFADADATTEITKEDIVIPAFGHDFVETVIPATFEEDGQISQVCSRCGEEKDVKVIAHVEIAKLSETEGIYDGNEHKPEVILQDANGENLAEDAYVVEYPAAMVEPGTYTITVTLQGNYEGSVDLMYSIKKAIPYFLDVQDDSAWYYGPVYWAAENGITTGTSTDLFSPLDGCNRAMVVTFLYRLAGEPEVVSGTTFNDVYTSDYYYKAVSWAAANGITTGYNDGSGKFGPKDLCTREQVVTFLYRYAKASASGSTKFSDVKTGSYYYNAVVWAEKNGVTTGISADKFGVGTTCNRAMVVTFLNRYATL